ncbi:MAG: hypothetical protein ACKVOK_17110, partial [Flavobacteriales bacterium]
MPDQAYHISYWAKTNNNFPSTTLPRIRFAAFEIPLEHWYGAMVPSNLEMEFLFNALGIEGELTQLGLPHIIPYPTVLTPQGDWHCVTYDFVFNGDLPAYTILIYDDVYSINGSTSRGCFIDDISIVPIGSAQLVLESDLPLPDENGMVYNLAQYVTPQGGIFSGPGVSVEYVNGMPIYNLDASLQESSIYVVHYHLTTLSQCDLNYCLSPAGGVEVSFNLSETYCDNDEIIELNDLATPSGGVFTGEGVDYQPGFGYFIDLSQITADQIEITYTVEISGGFEYSTSEIIN